MKKIFFTTCYLILAFSILAQINIPINSSENTRVSNWLITKVSDFKEEQVERILNNTQDFYNDMLAENVKEINLSSYNDVTIALYQLYKEIDYKTTFVASCIIDINSEQLCGFEFSDISMDATLYINSEKVLSSIESNKKSFDYKLKKGENQELNSVFSGQTEIIIALEKKVADYIKIFIIILTIVIVGGVIAWYTENQQVEYWIERYNNRS